MADHETLQRLLTRLSVGDPNPTGSPPTTFSSPFATLLDLPVELVEQICDSIADQQTLARLARVSHHTYDPAIRRMLQNPVVRFKEGWRAFTACLMRHPSRVDIIRSMRLDFSLSCPFFDWSDRTGSLPFPNCRDITLDRSDFAVFCDVVLAMSTALPALRSITVTGHPTGPRPFNSNIVGGIFKQLLRHPAKLDTLRLLDCRDGEMRLFVRASGLSIRELWFSAWNEGKAIMPCEPMFPYVGRVEVLYCRWPAQWEADNLKELVKAFPRVQEMHLNADSIYFNPTSLQPSKYLRIVHLYLPCNERWPATVLYPLADIGEALTLGAFPVLQQVFCHVDPAIENGTRRVQKYKSTFTDRGIAWSDDTHFWHFEDVLER